MEKKKFFEVFQDLRLDQDISDLFEYVNVTRITANSTHTKMRIYIESSRLIEKSAIFTVRDEISRYLRAGKRIEIEIVEKYHLSEQYTRENLFQIYKESIILELNQISPIIATMFKKAPVRFEDNGKMVIDLESSIVSEARMKTLKDTIERIFANRFDMPIEVRIEKRLIDENRFAKRNARRLQNEVNVLLSKNQDIEEAEEKEKKEKPKRVRKATYSTDPDMVYGREFKFDADTKLSDVFEGTGETVVRGQIMTMEDSIAVKLFLGDENAKKEFYGKVKKNSVVRVKGVAKYDTYDRQVEISSVEGMRLIPAFTVGEKRKDTAVDKRVELHCHTNMSDMDGVSKCGKIVRRAYEWGHKAIAITDHGVVQAFPDAWHEYCDIKKECKREGKECDFKVIYGVEAYLVDDLKDMIVNPRGQKLDDTYVVFDLETTGFSAKSDKIIEIGAVKVTNGKIVDRFSTFVNPERPIPFRIEKLTSINDNMVINQPTIDEILPKFMEFCKGAIMVAHNADFDMSFIAHNCKEMGLECDFTIVDTVAMARYLVVGLGKYKLNNVAKALGIALDHHHRAVDDAECTALIFLKLCKMLEERGIDNLDDVNKEGKQSKNLINKLPAHHAIILVKDLVGRVNLYKLISISHIETFAKKPRILKSDYLKYCEGLMIGSACEAGELYQAILHGRPQQEVVRLAEFYDYFEVQPLGNNQFMLKTGNPEIDEKKKFTVDSIEDLKDVNRKIIELGRKFNKMTVATCDVHFLDPEDEIYRRIIQYGNGYRDADNQPPLYLRTTDEMLKEFDYLGSDVAEEIVITNPNKIADMIDNISPIHPDKCPPVLDNSEENLRKICFNRAHEIYGEDLPKIVEDRLEVELDSIIGNGYAVMYIMAQRLVWKSNEDGYLVGSRGSVGSSFAATMSGITECNPLAPHYYCEKCKSSFFEDEYRAPEGTDPKVIAEIQAVIKEERAEGGLGFDLPDMYCPHCGEKLHKDGLEIPFETFLGFGGTKEPDIDLNFSGEYQANAHAYTEVMFGKGHTFRAGTITGVADKTAFGYVKNYFDDHNIVKRTAEIDRIARGCTGIRRSTGQHPGGIVIVPRDKEIYDFTPIQKPANDMSVDTITTHFEYHAIDANLLKLDILGHDDPTMIRRLEKLTNTNVQKDVHFDDKKILSLFLSPEALGITSDDIDGCPTGTLGLPELGTDFVIQMLVDTKPTKIADLVRIAGLSHGTDVWLGNAQQLIAEGKCTISSAICTRDDIMVYLMDKGIEPQVSFDIMEHVRKGRGLLTYKDKETGEERQEEDVMREHNVPEWYIWSCKKIKYMFPKAHAAAYIMMALRVAWYKIYKPLAYYAAFFGIRAKAFNYETMCQGREKLEFFMADLKRKKANHEASKKDEDSLGDMKIVQEMYARGFEFLPIDIYTAKAHEFQIIDGKLMPSLDTIEGLGEKAADGLVDAVAAQDGPFVSKNDLREKSKLSKTVIETMSNLGLLNGMPEDSQLSIFDF